MIMIKYVLLLFLILLFYIRWLRRPEFMKYWITWLSQTLINLGNSPGVLQKDEQDGGRGLREKASYPFEDSLCNSAP